jgi:uncharacterized protein (DUF362 family)
MALIYSHSGDERNNVAKALRKYLTRQNKSLKKEKIIIKPNMVDPLIPDACTNAQTLQAVVNVLKEFGAKKILFGDEPASYFIQLQRRNGQQYDWKQDHKSLGFDKIKGAKSLNLDDLTTTSYRATRLNPYTTQEEAIQIPIRDTSGYRVVSLALPKHHGNYNYSGVSKNLMGLVPQDRRVEFFHYSIWTAAKQMLEREQNRTLNPRNEGDSFEINLREDRLVDEFVEKYCELRGQNKFTHKGILQKVYNAYIDQEVDQLALSTIIDHLINAGSLTHLIEHVKETNKDGIYILDATHLMKRHEHAGELVKTDFALVGNDPVDLDTLAMKRLEIDPKEVAYLDQATKTIHYNDSTPSTPQTSLIARRNIVDQHGLPFISIPLE